MGNLKGFLGVILAILVYVNGKIWHYTLRAVVFLKKSWNIFIKFLNNTMYFKIISHLP